jgi:hypothetical protein
MLKDADVCATPGALTMNRAAHLKKVRLHPRVPALQAQMQFNGIHVEAR